MEEPDERDDASLGVSESTVISVERVVDDSSVSLNKGQVRSSLSVEVGDGACNAAAGGGEDIMVEVLGSDVYFDGVCTDRTAGNFDEVGSTGEDPNVERARGDAGVVEEPVIGVSGGVESEAVSGVGESIKETLQEGVEADESVVDAVVLDKDARADDSLVVAGHVDSENEAVHVEEGNIGSMEAMDIDTQAVSFQGSLDHSSPDDKVVTNEEPHKVEIHTEKSTNFPTENGFGDDSMDADEGSQFVSDGGKSLEKEPGQKSVEEGKQVVDTPVDQQDTEIGVSDVDARNLKIKTSASSADGIENSNSLGQDATEEATNRCSKNDLNPEVISYGDGAEKDLSNLERDESCIVEIEHVDVAKSDHVDDQNQVDREGPKSVEVPEKEKAAQALDNENSDPSVIVPENVTNSDSAITVNEVCMDSISPNQPNHNAEIECRNMESDPQSNGQGEGGTGMNVEETAVVDNNLNDLENVEGMEVDQSFNAIQVGLHVEEEMEDATAIYNDDDQIVECAAESPESSVKLHQARYHLPPENDGDFSVSDLVWGKVRSHPWWPGQIFDPSDSSDKAMKYYKKDFFLVAYFGDRSFAWNEVSHLKPFRTHFSQEEMQSHSESFQNSVECALEEVSRRSELGLACACTPREAYDMIECQVIENAGIREESSRRYGVDNSASATSFEPAKLIEYIRDLAKFPFDDNDRLELVIAKAQLTSFYRLKGYSGLPQFQFGGQFQFCPGLADREFDSLGIEMQSSEYVQHLAPCQDDAQTSSYKENLEGRSSSYHKRKHNLKDGLYPKKKDKSLYELMGENLDNFDGDSWSDANTTAALVSPSTKRRKTEHPTDDSGMPDGRKTVSLAKASGTAPLKQSFKIGDCIRRVASQMTGTPPIVKSNSDRFERPDGNVDGRVVHESDIFLQNFDEAQRERANLPSQYSALDELLGQLQLVASDPMKEYNFVNVIVSFFTDFRDSLILRQQPGIEEATDKISGKRRAQFTPVVLSQTFEFEDMSDTYWTDRVIHNGIEVQPPRKIRKRDYQLAIAEPGKSLQGSRRPYKKRQTAGNHAMPAEMFSGSVNQPSSAELVMNFAEVDSVPSEKTLNNMFRRFGPLRESETEVDREGGRARVVFKKSSDAEIAYGSAGRFNIFGPRLVNYQLSYTPSTLFKASPIPRLQDQEMHLDLSATQFQEMQLDLSSFHDHEMQLDLSSIHDQDMQLDLSTIEYQEMESVLAPNHDQESKPNYTAHLGEMQGGFSTIQYERRSDLSSMHDQELQTVFALNQETHSGHVTAQDQELNQHFTSTQLGDMQADHTITSHHDELQEKAQGDAQLATTFTDGQETQVLDTVEADEPEHDFSSKELATQSVTDGQDDTQPFVLIGKESQEETQPIFASMQELTVPDLPPVQELEHDEEAMQGHELEQEQEVQHANNTYEEQEMQYNIATDQELELEQEKQYANATDLEQEKQWDSAAPIDQEQEKQCDNATNQELEHDEEAMQGQELEHGEEALQENELQPDHVTTEEHEVVPDSLTSQVQDVQSNHGTELEQDLLPNNPTNEVHYDDDAKPEQEVQHANNNTYEEQEMQYNIATNQEMELEKQYANATDREQEKQWDSAATTDQEQEKKCDNATNQELEHDEEAIQGQELEHDEEALQENEMQPDHVTTQEHEPVPDSLTSQVQDVHTNHATELEHDLLPDNPTNEVHCDDDTKQEQEVQHANNTTQEQEMQYDIATDQEQEKQYANTIYQEQEKQWDNGAATYQVQEKQCDNATNQEQEMQCDNATNQEKEMQCDNATNQEQEMKCDDTTSHASIREQEMKCDDTTIQKQEIKCDVATIRKCDDATSRKQEMKCDDATIQEQEMQCDDATREELEMQSDNVGSQEQEMQCDNTHEGQDMQSDNVVSQEQEMQCDNATHERQDMQSDNVVSQEQMQCDNATREGQDMQSDNVVSQEQELQCENATHEGQDMQSDYVMSQEQEMQCDDAMREGQDMQSDNVVSQEQELQSDNTTSHEQDMKGDTSQEHEMQCDNTTSQEQEMQGDNDSDNEPVVQSGEVASNGQVEQSEREEELQADYATNQEQETESSLATFKHDIKSDVAEKHPTQGQVTESDVGANPEPETHSTILTKD